MTFLEAALAVLRRAGKSMSVQELTKVAVRDKLLSVVGRDPEGTMASRLDEVFANGGYHDELVRIKPGVFGLKRYPPAASVDAAGGETSAAEGAAQVAGDAGAEAPGGASRRRRRRRRGRSGAEGATEGAAGEAEDGGLDGESPESPALAGGEPQPARPRLPELLSLPKTAMASTPEDEPRAEPVEDEQIFDETEAMGEGDEGPVSAFEDAPVHEDEDRRMRPAEVLSDRDARGKRRRGRDRERKGRRGDAPRDAQAVASPGKNDSKDKNDRNDKNASVADKKAPRDKKKKESKKDKNEARSASPPPAPPPPGPLAGGGVDVQERSETVSGASAAASAVVPSASPERQSARPAERQVRPSEGFEVATRLRGEIGRLCQGAFALILEGRGRGMNAAQLAEQLGAGGPEATRRLRVGLLLEERWLTSQGARSRVRGLGGGQYAAWGRRIEGENAIAETELAQLKQQLRATTLTSLARRLERLSPASFELLAMLLLERAGWQRFEVVRRTPEVLYLGATSGQLSTVRALVAVRLQQGPVDRRAVGELRAGLAAKGFDLGLLLSARRLDSEGQAELERGRGVELWTQPQLAARLLDAEIGVLGSERGEPMIDPELWAELE